MYSVSLSKDARRFFERSDAALQRRLDRCFDRLRVEPHNGGNIKPLKGSLVGRYRYRVGDYRVVYRIYDPQQTVHVLKIAHRSEVYE